MDLNEVRKRTHLTSSPLAGENQYCSAPIWVGGLTKVPSPSTGEGKGGGECQRRLSIELSPIPPFPARGESV